MKYSLYLIRKYLDSDITDQNIFDSVSRKIAEIEEITNLVDIYKEVTVAEIVEAADHPGADKLGVYQVKTSAGTVQVVAGDKSLRPGDKVAYIAPGINVPSSVIEGQPFEIKKAQLRGQESNGMLASEKELAISDEHAGVLKLPEGNLGQSLSELFSLGDSVFEIENKSITHRPDLFGHVGMAREIAAVNGIKFNSPDYLHDESPLTDQLNIKLTVESENVSRFTISEISEVQVKQSDLTTKALLTKLGIKTINNLVDATNMAWIQYAQPMHVFDLDKLKKLDPSLEMRVYDSPGDETIELLDGSTIKTVGGEVVIAIGDQPISLAGAMGGSTTEVDQDTKNIVLEAASFDMYRTRRTSMQHGIFTDAVTVFSRGQDAHKPAIIQRVAVDMLGANDKVTAFNDYGSSDQKTDKITVSASRISELLGKDFSSEEIAKILDCAEISSDIDGDTINVTVPYWRKDLNISEDIVEEVGRLYGFDDLGFSLPSRSVKSPSDNLKLELRSILRNRLSRVGANEVLSYNFVSSKLLDKVNFSSENSYRIRNALSPELEFMRETIVPNLLEFAQKNYKQNFDQFVLFEIGKTHTKALIEDDLPVEIENLAMVAVDEAQPFYLLKRYLETALKGLGKIKYLPISDSEMLHPGRSALVLLDDNEIGFIGEPKLGVKKQFKLNRAAVAEINLSGINSRSQSAYQSLSEFPSSFKDLTVQLSDEFNYSKLSELIDQFFVDRKVQVSKQFKSVYRSDEMKDIRNISFNLEFYSHKRTLTNKEVNVHMDALSSLLSAELQAKVV